MLRLLKPACRLEEAHYDILTVETKRLAAATSMMIYFRPQTDTLK